MAPQRASFARPVAPGGARVARPINAPMTRKLRRLRNEGWRGTSVRASVALRYISYWFVIVGGSALAGAFFAEVPNAQSGGLWMLLSTSFQLAVAAIGTIFYANRRHEIIEQVRAYVFGYTLFPGLGVAAFMWTATRLVAYGSQDAFVHTLTAALPWIYFLPVVLPAVIFAKTVAGLRMTNRLRLDDEEIMQIYTRNDGLQR